MKYYFVGQTTGKIEITYHEFIKWYDYWTKLGNRFKTENIGNECTIYSCFYVMTNLKQFYKDR